MKSIIERRLENKTAYLNKKADFIADKIAEYWEKDGIIIELSENSHVHISSEINNYLKIKLSDINPIYTKDLARLISKREDFKNHIIMNCKDNQFTILIDDFGILEE